MAKIISWLPFLTASIIATDVPDGWIQKEQDASIYMESRSMWQRGGKPHANHSMSFTVAIRIDDYRQAELEKTFWEVSDPDHANYGKYLSVEQISELLAIPAERVFRVRKHFETYGANCEISPSRDMIKVTMQVHAAERALATKLHTFTHKKHTHARRIIRASERYFLPFHVAADVRMVGELLQFPRLARKKYELVKSGSGSWPNDCSTDACKGLVTPGVLAKRYKLPADTVESASSPANSMSVAEYQDQQFDPSDLKLFSSKCNRDMTVSKVIGGNDPSPGIECELDIEYIRSVAPSVPLTVVYNAEYSLLDWANQITNLPDSPLVHSVSYGNDEAQQSSTSYMLTCNTAFMKAGVRGLSILFASGDQGVCGREGCGWFRKKFHPDFPAASPYITAVGGTDFLTDDIGEETAWPAGGGGFSDTFSPPDYQKSAVNAYLTNPDAKLPPSYMWNASGRGYPDVAALGGQKTPYCIATEGRFAGVAGTSASCPVVAGVFARLNGLRLAAGKPAMGFLNPFIYKNPAGFQDVTHGTNNDGTSYGFTAIKGWDAATGMGTPNFEELSKLAMLAGASAEVVV